MTASQRERWDAKHAAARAEPDAPDAFVLACLDEAERAQAGRALDLACGRGRHALELARRGWSTTACDVSSVGLDIVEERARAERLEVERLELDLETSDGRARLAAAGPWDLVVVANFLDRELLRELPSLLARGGRLIYATFHVDAPGGKPPARFRLERGELARALSGLRSIRSIEDDSHARAFAERV